MTGAAGFENGLIDNPDNDSLLSVFEWIFGGNPLAPDSPALLPELTKSGPWHQGVGLAVAHPFWLLFKDCPLLTIVRRG